MRKNFWLGIATLVLGLASTTASAWCDFLTGGGFIITTGSGIHEPAKGTFGVGGGCKNGEPWGHLEYQDHANGLNVHWLTITGYHMAYTNGDENDPKRTGARYICGTARTNLYGDVDFVVAAVDNGEPGEEDWFILRLRQSGVTVYTTEGDADHSLGGSDSGGGNLQLHKPNASTEEFAPYYCAALQG
jgi:hypothetical protein